MATQRQIEANRQNQKNRKGLTQEGRAKLSQSGLRNRPWLKSTGPRTRVGKERSRWNSWKHGNWSAECVANRKALAEVIRELRDLGLLKPSKPGAEIPL